MEQLIEKEQDIMQHFGLKKGFRKTIRLMHLMTKLYNSLCNDCKQKVFSVGYHDPKKRNKLLGDIKTYCEKCKPKVKDILPTLERLGK